MRQNLILAGVLIFLLAVFALPAFAAEPPPHDHYLLNPGTGVRMQVGPQRCALGETVHEAFLNFHNNVHVGSPRTEGGLVLQAEFC